MLTLKLGRPQASPDIRVSPYYTQLGWWELSVRVIAPPNTANTAQVAGNRDGRGCDRVGRLRARNFLPLDATAP